MSRSDDHLNIINKCLKIIKTKYRCLNYLSSISCTAVLKLLKHNRLMINHRMRIKIKKFIRQIFVNIKLRCVRIILKWDFVPIELSVSLPMDLTSYLMELL